MSGDILRVCGEELTFLLRDILSRVTVPNCEKYSLISSS